MMRRWRRGCATDGHEMTDNSEASSASASLSGDLGCQQVSQRSEDRLIVVSASPGNDIVTQL